MPFYVRGMGTLLIRRILADDLKKSKRIHKRCYGRLRPWRARGGAVSGKVGEFSRFQIDKLDFNVFKATVRILQITARVV